VGQYLNTYNELSLAYLVKNGATHITVPVEMPAEALKVMGKTAKTMRVCLEVQVFGRMGLALSARCYHARAHGRVKDNCQFVCGQDPDGMALKTLTGQDFLCVNGIQTLSDSYLCLAHELHAMSKMGINHFRLSPHHVDMVGVARCFAEVLSGSTNPEEAENQLVAICGIREFTNGFYYGRAGNIKHRG
jgi:collagenase-like PrtC family protease